MAYFITEAQRKQIHATCFFEFQKGKPNIWGRKRFWKEDSLLLHMDIFDQLDLYAIFHAALPDFDYYGETTVTADHYEVLKAIALAQDGEISNVFEELDAWVSECFKTETCFTILGI
jgi:hypothetical protein